MRRHDAVPQELLKSEVQTETGETVAFTQLIDGPTLLVFIRHFGCLGCTVQVAALEPRLLQLHEMGVRTILVGNGNSDFIEEFRRRHNLLDKKATVVTDPSLGSFRAVGLPRKYLGGLGIRGLVAQFKAIGDGFRRYRGTGDDFQQGGMVLITGERIGFYHANQHLGDLADINDLMEIVMAMAARPKGEETR